MRDARKIILKNRFRICQSLGTRYIRDQHVAHRHRTDKAEKRSARSLTKMMNYALIACITVEPAQLHHDLAGELQRLPPELST